MSRKSSNRQNPKAEGRGPKEGRRPKTEWANDGLCRTSYGTGGEESSCEAAMLREEAEGDGAPKPPPRELLERTAQFGEAIIEFAKKIPQNPINNRLIDQLVGAGTSIGANFCEADDSVSGKEFKQKIGICRKESKETRFFLRMVAKAEPGLAAQARILWREANELNLIFGAIWRK
jgi:four helix bundle protein